MLLTTASFSPMGFVLLHSHLLLTFLTLESHASMRNKHNSTVKRRVIKTSECTPSEYFHALKQPSSSLAVSMTLVDIQRAVDLAGLVTVCSPQSLLQIADVLQSPQQQTINRLLLSSDLVSVRLTWPLGVLVHVIEVWSHDEVLRMHQTVLVSVLFPACIVALVSNVAFASACLKLSQIEPRLVVL